MRPSSQLRTTRLLALLDALSVRDLGSLGACALLGCSASSARNYLLELMDAGVVGAIPNSAEGADRTVYRLGADRLLVAAFKAALTITVTATVPGRAGAQAAGRDPLVAALFGAPPPAHAGEQRAA